MAASPRSIISVITELPFLNNNPPIAGRSANARGAECHGDESEFSCPMPLALGSRRSSVDSWNALRASLKLKSERFDERRRESPPITFVDCRRLRRWESSTVKARRRGAPLLVDGSSSAMSWAAVDAMECLAWRGPE